MHDATYKPLIIRHSQKRLWRPGDPFPVDTDTPSPSDMLRTNGDVHKLLESSVIGLTNNYHYWMNRSDRKERIIRRQRWFILFLLVVMLIIVATPTLL